jgi:hypothetical protein
MSVFEPTAAGERRLVASLDPRAPRRAYERPRVTFREPLEAVAAVCTPPNGKSIFPCVVSSS